MIKKIFFCLSADLEASEILFLKIYLYFILPYSEASESVDHICNLVWPYSQGVYLIKGIVGFWKSSLSLHLYLLLLGQWLFCGIQEIKEKCTLNYIGNWNFKECKFKRKIRLFDTFFSISFFTLCITTS